MPTFFGQKGLLMSKPKSAANSKFSALINFGYLFIFANLISNQSAAECVSLVKGQIAFDVNTCGVFSPEKTFDFSMSRYAFIKDLPAANRKQFYDSYRGLLMKGRVAKSEAIRSGLSPEKGALNGENISVFVMPGQASCENLTGKRLLANLDEACCEGGGDVPCLLNTSFVLKDIKAMGEANDTEPSEKKKPSFKKSKNYLAAEKLFAKKDYKKAAALFEEAKRNKELDIPGAYKLGITYRLLDQCKKAIPILRDVYDRYIKNDFWAEDEEDIRSANFLLARCYSKLSEPGFAVVVLNAYILDPKKYRKELDLSLKHKDFGWIHTSKEYREYKKDAEKALSKFR